MNSYTIAIKFNSAWITFVFEIMQFLADVHSYYFTFTLYVKSMGMETYYTCCLPPWGPGALFRMKLITLTKWFIWMN